jgi:hypothetical protein
MRTARGLPFVLAAVVLTTGCTPVHRYQTSEQVRHPAPAPRDPDFTTLIERFYGQLEAGHWAPADAMVSDRYRDMLTIAALKERYRDFANADVNARQTGTRTVDVQLTAPAIGTRSAHSVHEIVTFSWNGEEWKIDRIDRQPGA